ncbi:uncharacterized protein LOC135693433 [Rhopilema esculentum]|uniref:uncharacterized protein LOC135693433 n=1 Tax=Rhopilema esculentum TaxID=499914 RepID=UPI0031DE5F04
MASGDINEILIWSVSGGTLLVLLFVIIICCSFCKRQGPSYVLLPSERPINTVRQPYYDSFRNFADYIINKDEIHVSKKLGEGSFGVVYVGVFRGSEVAVKTMLLPLCLDEGSQSFLNEVSTLSKLRNRYIVQFIGICLSVDNPCIIMEYMQGGSVADKIHKDFCSLEWKLIIKWSLDAAKGMEFLHAHKPQPIIHRDLKSDNLLVDENGVVKVGDFGTAKLYKKFTNSGSMFNRSKRRVQDDQRSEFPGTVCWAAPEVLPPKPPGIRGKYTTAADVYSYGITLWEMISNKRPFRGYKFEFQIMDAIISGTRPEIPSNCVPAMKELLNECWCKQIERRPTFEMIHRILDDWMTKIRLVEIATPQTRATFPPSGSLKKETLPLR